jgi:phage baseplate assembly protein W
MAQIIQNKFPIDSNARKAVGFGFPLNGDAVFVPTYQTRDQIRANLINYLLTNKGERVFNPNFGSSIREYVFEQLTNQTYASLEKVIQEDVQQYFPNVTIEALNIYGFEDSNEMQIELTYSVRNFGINDQINITI